MKKKDYYYTHCFHLVDYSPWPLMGSLSIFSFILNSYMWMNQKSNYWCLLFSLSSLIIVIYQWMRDVVRESTFQGNHGKEVCQGLYVGIMMFIISEVMFFFSFFFSYFFISLSPDLEIGVNWPPTGIEPFRFYLIPFLNTLILLSSGVSITWAHHCLLCSNYKESLISTFLSFMMGVIFMWIQLKEYKESSFSLADSVYGSIFFVSTGFHGVHVIIGVMMILISFFRIMFFHFSKNHHIGFEMSAWYWHFVDVVWLILFISIYWWGG